MLYTFSQADYPPAELQATLQQLTAQDVVVLWLDGVYLALKYPDYFTSDRCYVLAPDMLARGLSLPLPTLSFQALVALTEQHAPQVAF